MKEESIGKNAKPLKFFKSFFFKGDIEASLKTVFKATWYADSPRIGRFFDKQELKIKKVIRYKNSFRMMVIFLIV